LSAFSLYLRVKSDNPGSDPHVEKHRVKVSGRGVYVDVASLEKALRERGYRLVEGELDRHVRELGGQRLHRGKWLARVLRVRGLPRPAQYFLPEVAFQRVRQRR
jgi:hypothetical protein